MFNYASNFTVTAAEINDVQGSIRRYRSPTVVNFHNVPFGTHWHDVNQSAVNSFVPNTGTPAPPARTRRVAAGMFSNASNFHLVGAEVNRVQEDMVRTMSGTEMTVNFAQSNQSSSRTHRTYLHSNARHVDLNLLDHSAGRYDDDNAGTGWYNDPSSSPSVNYLGNPHGQSSGALSHTPR